MSQHSNYWSKFPFCYRGFGGAVKNFARKVQSGLPIVGLLSRLATDTGGIGNDEMVIHWYILRHTSTCFKEIIWLGTKGYWTYLPNFVKDQGMPVNFHTRNFTQACPKQEKKLTKLSSDQRHTRACLWLELCIYEIPDQQKVFILQSWVLQWFRKCFVHSTNIISNQARSYVANSVEKIKMHLKLSESHTTL